jgi:hypothetical protein
MVWSWFRKRSQARRARKLLQAAFGDPKILEGTSLKPRHKSRWVLVDFEVQEDAVSKIWFRILRHPRPYAFSRQSHKVIESYVYDVEAGGITRIEGRNITRAEGRDAD